MLSFVIGFIVLAAIFVAIDTWAAKLYPSEAMLVSILAAAVILGLYVLSWWSMKNTALLANHATTWAQLQIPLFGFVAALLTAGFLRYNKYGLHFERTPVIGLTIVTGLLGWLCIGMIAYVAFGNASEPYAHQFFKDIGMTSPGAITTNFPDAVEERFLAISGGVTSWLAGIVAYAGIIAWRLARTAAKPDK